jgi:large subunit ribosomal protein L18
MLKKINNNRMLRRKKRVSANLFGSADRPRIVVFRSNQYTTAQAIDDTKKMTLAACSSEIFKKEKELKKTAAARKVGQELGKKLLDKKIKQAIFDRSVYTYQGRIKELAEGLREAGIKV